MGHFFIAIDVEHFIDLHQFKKQTGEILRALRASEKAKGQEHLAYLERKDKGAPVAAVLMAQIEELKNRFDL